jgi:hypothetical protein
MAPKDMKKTTLIIKTRLYGWTVMPFGLKNDLNINRENWEEHLQHLDVVSFRL